MPVITVTSEGSLAHTGLSCNEIRVPTTVFCISDRPTDTHIGRYMSEKQPSSAHPVVDTEPELPEVAIDDRSLVRNIIYVATALNRHEEFWENWYVQPVERGYIVHLSLLSNHSVSIHDMLALRDVNSSRVTNVVITHTGTETHPKAMLRIQVMDTKQPIMEYEMEVVRVKKRARRWGF